tara:strand:- start:23 stop:478 length:456 start_codon:yes stop_codon:yes gene_type:complete
MNSRKNKVPIETIAGAVILIFAFTFLIYAFQKTDLSDDFRETNFVIYADFDSVAGLRVGSDIMLAGVKVGSVSEIELDAERYIASTTMNLYKDFNIPEDTEAIIVSDGLLGEKYISLNVGGAMDTLTEGDQIIYTQGSINIFNLLSKFADK